MLQQNLKTGSFVGTSANAPKTQIWAALICMVLRYLQMSRRLGWNMAVVSIDSSSLRSGRKRYCSMDLQLLGADETAGDGCPEASRFGILVIERGGCIACGK